MFGIKKRRPVKRPALPGEVCLCGAPAQVVFDDWRLGPAFGSCQQLDVVPRSGPCPFCGTTAPHAGVCPSYTLRPAWATDPARAVLAGVGGER